MAQALIDGGRTVSSNLRGTPSWVFFASRRPQGACRDSSRTSQDGDRLQRAVSWLPSGSDIQHGRIFSGGGIRFESPGRYARFAATCGRKIPAALYDAAFVTWRHEFRRLQSESPQPPEQFVWFKPTGPGACGRSDRSMFVGL